MKIKYITLLVFLTLGFTPKILAEDSTIKQLVEDNSAFACDLYQQLKTSNGNLSFSPYSISSALAMMHAGAKGVTRNEMEEVLHFSLNKAKLHPAFSKLQKQLTGMQQEGELQISVANSLWRQQGGTILQTYLDRIKKYYSAECRNLDFKTAPEESRQIINEWTAAQTEQRIKDLIPLGEISTDTSLVLANAIYFNGKWDRPFESYCTTTSEFYVVEGKTVQVPMMLQSDMFYYTEDNLCQVLEMSYKGNHFSMVFLLPKNKNGIQALEEQISANTLTQWTSSLEERNVDIFLPKFKVTSSFDLAETLPLMGMTKAFELGKSNFSGIDGTRLLFISKILHKAFVEVNEEGTEAAAATAIITLFGSARTEPPPIFRADHPFLFMIREKETNSILFMGRVMDPSQGL